jgi:hypothetical protein
MGAAIATASGTTYDLTATTVNPIAAEPATPREGGFVVRNRVNFANLTAAAPLATMAKANSTMIANKLRVLQIPKRTVVTDIALAHVPGTTVPSAANSVKSEIATANLGWGVDVNKSSAGTLTNVATAERLGYGVFAVASGATAATWTNKASGTSLFPAVATGNSAMAGVVGGALFNYKNAVGKSSAVIDVNMAPVPTYFPHGGYIFLQLKNATGTPTKNSSSAQTVSCAGTWEFQAKCQYVPE